MEALGESWNSAPVEMVTVRFTLATRSLRIGFNEVKSKLRGLVSIEVKSKPRAQKNERGYRVELHTS